MIPKSVLDYRTDADAWSAYLSDKAMMSDVSSLRYLSSGSAMRNTGFSVVPTRDGNTFSLGKGWALVIVSADPARQQAAAKVMRQLFGIEPKAKGPGRPPGQ